MTDKQLILELAGTVCRCGREKHARQTFCQDCYFSLRPALRRNLYAKLGDGYSEAYAAAVAYLTEIGILEGDSP